MTRQLRCLRQQQQLHCPCLLCRHLQSLPILHRPHQGPALLLRVACSHSSRQPLVHLLQRHVAARELFHQVRHCHLHQGSPSVLRYKSQCSVSDTTNFLRVVSQNKVLVQRLMLQRCTNMSWLSGIRELRPLLHLLLPLSIHWVAEEMTVSVLVDVTTSALCPGESTCSKAIYINGVQQTIVGIFKMVVLPLLGQLSDEYGRKPLLLITISTAIFPFVLLVWH
ncbi:hypothetical protein AAZX31_20G173900 [Glycine max]